MATATFTKTGTKATTSVKLDQDICGIKDINHDLLHQAYVSYLANGRLNLATTKTRGMVSGGGRKPWRQKGTGRARVGSSRTPVWRGGGIVFGPTGEENFSKKINIKAKRSAIRQALSAANNADEIRIIEELELKTPKTSELGKLLSKLDIKGYILLVTDNVTDNLKLASRNMPNVKVIQSRYLNVARLLDADTVVITKKALAEIEEWLKPVKKDK
jgi:large subunit ribosomal protein L4